MFIESAPYTLMVIFSRTGSIFFIVPPISESFSFGSGPGANNSPTSVGSFSPGLAPGRIVVVGVGGVLLEAAFVLSDSPFDVSFADESLVAAALTLLDDLSPVVSGFGGSAVEPVGELLVPELTPD